MALTGGSSTSTEKRRTSPGGMRAPPGSAIFTATGLPAVLSRLMRSAGAAIGRPATLRKAPVTTTAAWPSFSAGWACWLSITRPTRFTGRPTMA